MKNLITKISYRPVLYSGFLFSLGACVITCSERKMNNGFDNHCENTSKLESNTQMPNSIFVESDKATELKLEETIVKKKNLEDFSKESTDETENIEINNIAVVNSCNHKFINNKDYKKEEYVKLLQNKTLELETKQLKIEDGI